MQCQKIKRETDVYVASTALVAESSNCRESSGHRQKGKFVLVLVNVTRITAKKIVCFYQ